MHFKYDLGNCFLITRKLIWKLVASGNASEDLLYSKTIKEYQVQIVGCSLKKGEVALYTFESSNTLLRNFILTEKEVESLIPLDLIAQLPFENYKSNLIENI